MRALPRMLEATPFALIITGAAGLFFGSDNPIVHVPLLIILYPAALYLIGLRSPSPFRHGWWPGLLGAGAGLYWIAIAVHDYGGFPWPLAVPCAVLLGMYVGLWGGLFARIIAKLRPLRPLPRCLAAALLWYLLEWTRGWFLTGFPWLTLAAGQAAWPPLIQSVSLIGAYGLSGVLAGLGCLLAEAANSASSRRLRLGCGLAVPLLIVALLGYGHWRIAAFDATGPGVTLGLVQGNIRQDIKWDPAFQTATLDTYLDLSESALQAPGPRPQALIWPETALPFYFQNITPLTERIPLFAAQNAMPLIFGGPGFNRRDAAESRKAELVNRAFFLDAQGREQGRYDKEHLVPFGEYVPPFLDFAFLRPLLQGVGGFTPGKRLPLFRLPLQPGNPAAGEARIGMLICYEAIFPELARDRVADGATLLVNISNDAWYNRSSAPVQHLHLSLLRAVEQGRWMARCTNTGLTAFIDPLGRADTLGDMADGSGLFVSGVLTRTARALSGHTAYFALHPWLPGIALAALAALTLRLARGIFLARKRKQ